MEVTKMQFTEINYQGSLRGEKAHDYMWGVHVAGCADIEREIIRQFGRNVVKDGSVDYITTKHEASSLRELLDLIVDGETRDLGWDDDNVKVHNCVTKAFRGQRIIDAINQPENAAKLSQAIKEVVAEAAAQGLKAMDEVTLADVINKTSKRHILTAEERARGGRKARSK